MPTELMQPAPPPQGGLPAPRYAYVPARAVGAYLPKLTRKAFETYGFSTATLLTDWAAIVGVETAGFAAPERLKWPRGAGLGEEDANARGRAGAVLILRVDPARALDVEYKGQQILERINGYFGYRAVAELRILQAPLASAAKAPARPGIPPASDAPELAGIADERLRMALQRLKGGLMSRTP